MDEGAFSTIKLAIDGPVATLILDRPDRLNAFTAAMADEIVAAFDRTDADPNVRAVIVTGAGRGFCAGAELADGASSFTDLGSDEVRRDTGGVVALRIFDSLKPVIAAINGPAVGVGVTMTLPMDARLMADTARLGFVFAARGIVPEAASSWFLPRLVGPAKTLEWCLTGRLIGADEALASGLARSVHPADDLLPAASALAREMAAVAPVSAALTRRMIWRGLTQAHPMEAHRIDSALIASRGRSGDAAEGVASFLAKRPAAFPDRVGERLPDPWGPQPDWSDATGSGN